jgi:colicin import membrane protein
MGASRVQREEVLWDLHQENETIELEFTGETSPELFGIEPSKAKEMTSGLTVVLAEREVLQSHYLEVSKLEITNENLAAFKELRLRIVKNRTQGIEKWHKANKAFYLAGGRFVDAIKNKEIAVNEEMELKLIEVERHFDNIEKDRKLKINLERLERLTPYVEDITGLDFSEMNDYDFDDYILGKKTRFENEIAEAKKVVLERLEAERVELERLENQRLENEKLKKEAELKEAELQKERAKVESERKLESDKQAKIQAEKDAELKLEREERAKVEAQLKGKQDKEVKAELERLNELAIQTKEAEKAAKAPIKQQLTVWVDNFEIPLPKVANEKTILITEKFNKFKEWAKNEIQTI